IKRVEILGALQEMYPDVPPPNPEEIGQLRTLAQITTAIANLINGENQTVIEQKQNYIANKTIVDSSEIAKTLLEVVSEKTGYPTEMLEMEMDIEADLGIDSIKRVEILGALQEMYPDVPPPNPEEIRQLRTLAQITTAIANLINGENQTVVEEIPNETVSQNNFFRLEEAKIEPQPEAETSTTQILLQTIAEKTGYPLETIGMEMDLEKDLGIDKIKGFEIVKAMSEHFPNASKMDLINIAQLRTLGEIIDYIDRKLAQKKRSLSSSI
nr:phosphopantetheine-binding protein [Prochloraceae cyanobacterium]